MNYTQLTENERYQIYIMNKAGHSQQDIAQLLGRSASTISRERRRNHGEQGYRPAQAQKKSDEYRRDAYKACEMTAEVKVWIKTLIRQELSPQQVVDYLRRHNKVSLHHETVYRFIYADKVNGGELYRHLRVVSNPYRRRYGAYDSRGRIKNRVDIDERPTIVDKRHRVGDWEGDTIMGLRR